MLGRLLNRLQAKSTNAAPAGRAHETPSPAGFGASDDLHRSGLLGRSYRVLAAMCDGGERSVALRLRMCRTLIEWGRLAEATAFLEEVLADPVPCTARELDECGRLLLDLHRPLDALACFESALRMGWSDARRKLCLALQRAGKPGQALAECVRLLADDPSDVLVRQVEVQCHIDLKDVGGAESSVRGLLDLDPDNAIGWFDLGAVLRERGRHEEAADAFAKAIEKGASVLPQGGVLDLALAYETLGRAREAVDVLCRALARTPTPELHRTLGQALISLGSYERGWREHEFRWFMEPLLSTRARGAITPWEGQEVTGKTVLLRIEQGVGDTIQFMRYASLLKARGARVIFSAMDLARCYVGVDGLLGEDCTVAEIDYYANLMSLPLLFGTRVDSVPAPVPYLRPPEDECARWQSQFPRDGVRNIALVWAGNPGHPGDRHRSMQVERLEPLLGARGCRFFSLQKGATSDATRHYLAAHGVTDLESSLATYRDTAAIVENMDLIITVDTSVAHLAGAMGRPTWVMLATPAEWRWGQYGATTPWYPSMRLFRQATPGDWAGVVEAMANELASQCSLLLAATAPSDTPAARRAVHDLACADPRQTGAVLNQRDVLLQYIPEAGYRGRSLEVYGEYLQPWLDFLIAIDLRGMTLLDLDAGWGEHVIPIARSLGGSGSILAGTNDKIGRMLLRQNLAANDIVGVSVLSRSIAGVSSTEADTVDDLCLAGPAWIKFDAATPLVAIVEGAQDTLWKLRPGIAGVVAGDAELRALHARLMMFGYRCSTRPAPLFAPGNAMHSIADHFPEVRLVSILAVPEEAVDPVAPQLRAEYGFVDI